MKPSFLQTFASHALAAGIAAGLALPAAADCTADITRNGFVNGEDLSILLSNWGPATGNAVVADFNDDGFVNGADLSILLSTWGSCLETPDWATLVEAVPDPAVVFDSATRDAIIATGFAWRVRDAATQIEMVLIPPGVYAMGCVSGSSAGCDADESPQHAVTITEPFYMGRYEVTQGQWTAVMGSNPSQFVGAANSATRPVERVTNASITSFLAATGLRLPFEAEWEYAYRAGTTTAYHGTVSSPGGVAGPAGISQLAWYSGNSGGATWPVGGKAANGFGLHDMSGNVWERTADPYLANYYSVSPSSNPTGPDTAGGPYVSRGGAYDSSDATVRGSNRLSVANSSQLSSQGLRVARFPGGAPSLWRSTPASGPTAGGTAITIRGANLRGTTSVTVGGVAASGVTVVDDTKVTAVTPAGTAGLKQVVLTTPRGSSTLPGGFIYTATLDWATVVETSPDPTIVTDAGLRDAITATGLPWRVRDSGTNIEMVLIPPGTFDMGCSASDAWDCYGDESPVHTVTLTNAFYLGRYEVTQAQWTARMGSNPSSYQSASAEVPAAQVPSRPVETVSWTVVQGFLSATGMRLPSEAEWEYAYRAGTTTAFHGFTGYLNGTNDDTLVGSIAWYGPNASAQPRPVGGKSGNGFGLHDMSGNVYEWCNDWDGIYPSSAQKNPAGSTTGLNRVLRGGSSSGSSRFLRASSRGSSPPDNAASNYGFRVARAPFTTPVISSVAPGAGSIAGGTTITITGSNLLGASAVTVGGVAASGVTVIDASTLTAVTPAGTVGARDVVVTTSGGSATAAGAFTYLAFPRWATVLEALPDPAIVPDAGLRSAIVATGFPWRVRDSGTNIEMVLIPPGTFDMGCSPSLLVPCNLYPDESPVHTVTLTSAYYIGRYEVTQAQWVARVGSNPSYWQPPQATALDLNRPIELVSWNAVQSFLSGTGLRLLTEAEWEHAYRAGTSTAFHEMPGYPDGTDDDALAGVIAWFTENNTPPGTPTSGTKAVGQKAPNGFGLHDMSGNVWEMCSDWFSSTYYGSSPSVNPTGPTSGLNRVMRGGSYIVNTANLRASRRGSIPPGNPSSSAGFRVARNP
jgi:formylglycine-generating enzyme required for sulfatase activity